MATTLGFVMTDADFAPAQLRDHAVDAAVKRSYNRICVDGDTSTNDTLLLLANGASGCEADRGRTTRALQKRLREVMETWRSRSCAMAKARAS